jgi:hypothetical protein
MPHKKTKKPKGSQKLKKKSIRKTKVLQKKTQKKVPKEQKDVLKGELSKQDKNCCMCLQSIENKFFNPSKCFQEHGSRAHRICAECWWGEFAKEGTNHICPGCEKNMPLPPKNTEKTKPGATIILVDE